MKETNIYKITKIYSKKEFKEIKKNLEKKELKPIILGNINLDNKYNEKHKEDINAKNDIVYIKEKEKEKYFYILDKEELKNRKISKYGYIGNEEFLPLFIQIKRNPLIFWLWFLSALVGILTILLLMPCPRTIKENKNPLEIANGQALDGEEIQNGKITQPDNGSIEIPCYFDLYLKTNEPLKLINPKENNVYFVYTIYENGEQIYKSKAIAPDTMILSRLPYLLPVGEHNLVFDISTFDIETQEPCNGAQMEVKLTTEKGKIENLKLDTDDEKLEFRKEYYEKIYNDLLNRDDLTTLEIVEKENLEKFFADYEENKELTGKEYLQKVLKENEENKKGA